MNGIFLALFLSIIILNFNKMKKFLVLIVFAIVACKEPAQSTVQSGNFNVEYLFENDGCKLYRFQDGVRYVYYSDCTGKTEYAYQVRNGKHGSTTQYVENSTSSTKKK